MEESIHEAYIDAITKAEHYVYIENQFFISLATHNASVRNHVCETLFKRIVRAHK
jgi:phospholipase D1/2